MGFCLATFTRLCRAKVPSEGVPIKVSKVGVAVGETDIELPFEKDNVIWGMLGDERELASE